MYSVTSSARLDTTAPPSSGSAAVLAQHPHDLAPDEPVRWEITTPFGGVPHTGHLRLNGLSDDGFIAATVAAVTEDLLADQASRPETRPS
jgi:hypothetical protein